jgi:hypothetical protein
MQYVRIIYWGIMGGLIIWLIYTAVQYLQGK